MRGKRGFGKKVVLSEGDTVELETFTTIKRIILGHEGGL